MADKELEARLRDAVGILMAVLDGLPGSAAIALLSSALVETIHAQPPELREILLDSTLAAMAEHYKMLNEADEPGHSGKRPGKRPPRRPKQH